MSWRSKARGTAPQAVSSHAASTPTHSRRHDTLETASETIVTSFPDAIRPDLKLGKYFTLSDLCTCTQTYHEYGDRIQPFPENPGETIPALQDLATHLLDPIAETFGRDRLRLTYGFCSHDLRRYLTAKDPRTGKRRGRIAPRLDQHAAFERNRHGNYVCRRPGAACDLYLTHWTSDRLVDWILDRDLPFDSLYFYGNTRPIHLSYGAEHKRAVWSFDAGGTVPRRGVPWQTNR